MRAVASVLTLLLLLNLFADGSQPHEEAFSDAAHRTAHSSAGGHKGTLCHASVICDLVALQFGAQSTLFGLGDKTNGGPIRTGANFAQHVHGPAPPPPRTYT